MVIEKFIDGTTSQPTFTNVGSLAGLAISPQLNRPECGVEILCPLCRSVIAKRLSENPEDIRLNGRDPIFHFDPKRTSKFVSIVHDRCKQRVRVPGLEIE